ncbi:2-(S)-hydroxypropyl-CoM dehydrogenase [compost metagenome]
MSCVIITGAAGGVGRAMVDTFVRAGYVVVAVDKEPRPVECRAAHYFVCDLARTVSDEACAASIFTELKLVLAGQPLAALINNAAIQILGGTESLDRAAWQTTLNVNLLAPFFWAQAFLPELESGRGSILNISSIHARLTKAGFTAYATSKAALSGLTRAMAVDLGPRVSVNAIEPAAIGTDMLEAGFANNPAGLEALKAFHPVGCIGTTEQLADMALFVVSGSRPFMSGTVIQLDGAISSRLHDPC